MYAEDLAEKMQAVLNRRQRQTVNPAGANSDTLVDSAVTVHRIHTDYEEGWKHTPLSELYTHYEGLQFNSADIDTNICASLWWFSG